MIVDGDKMEGAMEFWMFFCVTIIGGGDEMDGAMEFWLLFAIDELPIADNPFCTSMHVAKRPRIFAFSQNLEKERKEKK